MREYNDYFATVRRWLKNYKRFQVTIANLNDDIEMLSKLNRLDVSAPISKYSDMPGGGTPELNSVESSAEKHMEREKRIAEKRRSVESIELTITKLDRALACLPVTEGELVRDHYIEGESWDALGERYGYTEKWARTHGSRGIRELAEMLFGFRADGGEDVQLSFVFVS